MESAILPDQFNALENMSQRFNTDILVIGGGAAGLTTALLLAEHARVTVLCKGDIASGSSHWAQGGVASVTDPEDSFDAHVRDTCFTIRNRRFQSILRGDNADNDCIQFTTHHCDDA